MAQILFIDDDSVTLKMLCKIAELGGHQPLTAQSGRAGLDEAVARTPDLIVVDMMMPDMDGTDVIARLRDRPETSHIPVIVLSAGPELDAQDRVEAAGGQGYLLKPISVDTLLEVIGEHTRG